MILKIPIFGSKVRMYSATKKELKKLVKKYDLTPVDDYDAFVFPTAQNEPYDFVVVFRKGLKQSVIVHEANHLTNMVLTSIGHEVEPENDEVQSYLIQWLFERIDKWYKKNKKNDKFVKG